MASAIPTQSRAVDPFASYNSSTVNQLTNMITRGNNGLTDYNAIQVTSDSTSPLTRVVVSTGSIYKDDVFITLTSSHIVDFEDPNHYISFGTGFNETGWYYIVLDYTYVKSRPAPQASIKILKPSQIPHPSLGTSLFFIKAVEVIWSGSEFEVSQLADYDLSTPTIRREYTPLYIGVETGVPVFSPQRDQGRIVYDSLTDQLWVGLSYGWSEGFGSGGSVVIPNVVIGGSVWIGCIAYIDSNYEAQPAIASTVNTRADGGIVLNSSGITIATMVGFLEQVQVESGITISIGDILYLSGSEAGKVTNVKPANFIQDLGRAATAGDDVNPINMIFIPRAMLSTSIRGVIEPGDWILSGSDYFYDIDITNLDSTGYAIVTSFFSDSTGEVNLMSPQSVQLVDNFSTGLFDTLRVWMATNTERVLYNLSAGIGSGEGGSGGGGTTNHSLLSNLDYATSGHTGFAPSPHGNADHSSAFIIATDVTYNNLNDNGDVGGGIGQVADGQHTHVFGDTHNYNDIPIGSTILFDSDTAIVGYTLKTDVDDGVVYITKGSVAGGQTGGTNKTGGTWTQPDHTHTGPSHTHTMENHTHSMQSHTHTGPNHSHSHNHQWYNDVGAGTAAQSYNSGGSPVTMTLTAVSATHIAADAGGNEYATDYYTNNDATAGGTGNTGAPSTSSTGAPSDNSTASSGTGATGPEATVNSWRPVGRNFTRQQRS